MIQRRFFSDRNLRFTNPPLSKSPNVMLEYVYKDDIRSIRRNLKYKFKRPNELTNQNGPQRYEMVSVSNFISPVVVHSPESTCPNRLGENGHSLNRPDTIRTIHRWPMLKASTPNEQIIGNFNDSKGATDPIFQLIKLYSSEYEHRVLFFNVLRFSKMVILLTHVSFTFTTVLVPKTSAR